MEEAGGGVDHPKHKLDLRVLLLVGIAAFAVRAVFVHGAIELTRNDRQPFEANDAPEYLHLARNIAFNGCYVRADAVSRIIGLVRPPGYPLLCAIVLKICGDRTREIVWAQVPAAAAICVLVAALAQVIFRARWPALLAGSIAALSPTGIGLTAQVFAEIAFTLVFLCGFLCLFAAAARGSARWAIIAGVVLAFAQLIKPSLMLWPLAGVAPWWCIARAYAMRVRWLHVLGCSAIQLAGITAWSARNYHSDGLLTISAVNARNLRMLVTPMVEEWVKAGGRPETKAFDEHYRQLSDR